MGSVHEVWRLRCCELGLSLLVVTDLYLSSYMVVGMCQEGECRSLLRPVFWSSQDVTQASYPMD